MSVGEEKKQFISVAEAAKRAGTYVQNIYRWLDKGKISGVRVANRRYVDPESLDEFMRPKPDGAGNAAGT